jgi:dipeptidyl aminopeptidase/acylaminoacyl peptidase
VRPVTFMSTVALLLFPHVGVRTACAAPAPAAASATQRLVSLEDLFRLRAVADPRVSPDGAWVAYCVTTPNVEADRAQSDLWMTSWDGATTLQLTRTPMASESSPRWSPDGRSLAFLSGRGSEKEAAQLWILPRAGGEAEQVSGLKSGIADFAWAPDGKRFVFVVADTDSVSPGIEGGKDRTPPPIVIDRLYFKEDVTGYLTHKRTHLYLFDLASRKAEQLTSGDYDDVNPAWSPDGRSLAFLSKRGPDPDRGNNWEIHTVEARPGAGVRQVTHFEGSVNNPGGEGGEDRIAWSPDGSQIAFLQGGPPKLIYYAVNHLAVVPAAGGPVRVLTAGVDRWVSQPAWAPDGRSVYVVLEDDRATQLVRVPLDGGRPEPVLAGRRAVMEFDVSASGRVAALVSTATTLPEVFAVEGSGPRALSRQNDSLLAVLRLGAVEEASFKSRDGTVVNGFTVKPPDYRAGVRYPALLRIHGGPVGQFACQFMFEWQLLAAQGYLVVAANPRGSSGRGEAYASAIYADWGNKDTQDVLAAVDDAVARGLADPKRLGVGGWSYGGMLTNYVITKDRRFKAATSGASISNALAGYGTDMYVREYEGELGTPWTSTAAYLKVSSPFLHADRIVTPTLFLCGENDFDVPLLNSEQMYQALRSLGRETQLVIYPDQTHGLTKPSYMKDRLGRYVEWYARYLK